MEPRTSHLEHRTSHIEPRTFPLVRQTFRGLLLVVSGLVVRGLVVLWSCGHRCLTCSRHACALSLTGRHLASLVTALQATRFSESLPILPGRPRGRGWLPLPNPVAPHQVADRRQFPI